MGQGCGQRWRRTGKFCRSGMICRDKCARTSMRGVVFSTFFPLARGLLKSLQEIPPHVAA
jgi:hypothetical protein